MPKENRKRGKRAKKHEELVLKDEKEELKKELPRPEKLDATANATVDTEESPWPILDPDTKAYFISINDRLAELDDLYTQPNNEEAEDENEEYEDRLSLLRSALNSLKDNEISVATDSDVSVVLQRLIYSMDDFAKRVLLDRFSGQISQLCEDRFASHVIQTLIVLSGNTIQREQRGNVAKGPDDDNDNKLRTMSELLSNTCRELIPNISEHIFSQFASHIIRLVLLLLSGKTMTDQDLMASSSKRSQQWKSKQGPFKSIVQIHSKTERRLKAKPSELGRREMPTEFNRILKKIITKLKELLKTPETLKKAVMDPIAGPVVAILLDVEDSEDKSDSILDLVLEGFITFKSKYPDKTPEPSHFFDSLLREDAGSHLAEKVIMTCPDDIFSSLWSAHFKSKIIRLANHPIGNFVLSKAIARLDSDNLNDVISELDSEKIKSLIVNQRTGLLQSLCEKLRDFDGKGAEFTKAMMAAFDIKHEEELSQLLPCVLALLPLNSLKENDQKQSSKITVQGSHLVQSWIKLPVQNNESIVKSILEANENVYLELGKSPIASHILDEMLVNDNVTARDRRQFVIKLSTCIHQLADDRVGSYVAEHCWESCDVYLREKLIKNLLPHERFLQSSHYGRFLLRRLFIPLYNRRPEEWKTKMSQEVKELTQKRAEEKKEKDTHSSLPTSTDIKKGKMKRKMKERDEIDELFGDLGKKKAR